MRASALLLLSVLPAAACGGRSASRDARAGAPQLTARATYAIESQLDVGAAAVLPATAYEAVGALRGLRDSPGRTLFDLAEKSGVPAVGLLRSAMPSRIEKKVYGWIDARVGKAIHDGSPAASAIDEILATIETALAGVELSSELVVDGEVATHRLHSAGFAIAGFERSYPLDRYAATLALKATIPAKVSAVGDGSQLTLGKHAFGLPFGELALVAIEDAMRARHGADLRGTLGQVIDCDGLGADVADKCVLGMCVGHATELRTVCDAGLDHLADRIRAEITAVRFDAVTLKSGTANLREGAVVDGVGDELRGGVWTADLDLGQGPRRAPATFAGHRATLAGP